MISAWFQRADYSSVDLSFENKQEAIDYWNNLDIAAEDQLQGKLAEAGNDFCPWGLGIGFNTDFSCHIYREDIEKDIFSVSIESSRIKKFMGIFTTNVDKEKTHEKVSAGDVPGFLGRYFDKDESLLE